jgi:beta-1,4-mannosyltransferase
VLVQNPPSLPTLAVAWLAARLRGARFVVDWHNLGFTLLPGPLGWTLDHPVVRAARLFERVFGAACADAHITVTDSMRDFLRSDWGVRFVPPVFHSYSTSHAVSRK